MVDLFGQFELSDSVKSVVGIAVVFLVGIIMLDSIAGTVSNSCSISLLQQPTDEDTITVNGYVFEFDDDSNVESGHIPVTIGANTYFTTANLETAISQYVQVV